MDPDGSVYSCDFLFAGIVRYPPDGSKATRWSIPTTGATVDVLPPHTPSKIVRMPDGGLWISFWGSGHLGRFDEKTGELKVYKMAGGSYPYDLVPYRGRILYTEQALGQVGFFDYATATPEAVYTLTPVDYLTTVAFETVAPVEQTLTPTDSAISGSPAPVSGLAVGPFTQVPGGGAFAIWGLAVDERRAKIYFGLGGAVGTLQPPLPLNTGDVYVPAARSGPGPGGRTYRSGIVAWNRATPDDAGVTSDINTLGRLLPTGWIAGYTPSAGLSIGPNKLLSVDDPIGSSMNAPGNAGALKFVTTVATEDLLLASRTVLTRGDGGSYGYSVNAVRAGAALGKDETGFVFAPPDAASQPLVAGVLVLEASTGTISIVDAAGTNLGTYAYDWPAGYQIQGETIWDAFGMPPVSSARIVYSVSTGKIFPFGVSFDEATGDPTGIPALGPKSADVSLTLPAVWRGGRPLGAAGGTDLQLFNGGSSTAEVTLAFRPATETDQAAPPLPLPPTSVPAGRVVTLTDVLAPLGAGLYGTLEVKADSAISAFARVHALAADGGTYGYGVAGLPSAGGIPQGSRGVFVSAADSADGAVSDLVLVNPGDTAVSADVNLTAADGTAAGTRTVSVGPHATRRLASVWSAIAGSGTSLGRVDVVPDGPLFATLIRKDAKTGDADALEPFVIAK
jgi:hypothetical protein